MTNRWTIAMASVAALCLSTAAPSASITGAEVIERMQKRFEKSKTFSAKFERRLHWAVLDKELSRSGRIYTRKPGEFRVEVEDSDIVVADGSAIWAYSPENEQVLVSSYDGVLPTPWEILVEYSEQYSPVAVAATELDGRACYAVTMAPRAGAKSTGAGHVVRMRVWVDKKRWHLLMVEQTEANDNVLTHVLSRHRVDDKLKDELFTFQPPTGVQVIDRRSLPTMEAADGAHESR